MDAVGDLDRSRLDVGPARGPRAEDLGEERPIRLGLDRGADADEPAAGVVVVLERRLLIVRQDIAGRVEEDDGAELAEVIRVELARVVGDSGR